MECSAELQVFFNKIYFVFSKTKNVYVSMCFVCYVCICCQDILMKTCKLFKKHCSTYPEVPLPLHLKFLLIFSNLEIFYRFLFDAILKFGFQSLSKREPQIRTKISDNFSKIWYGPSLMYLKQIYSLFLKNLILRLIIIFEQFFHS